MIPTLRYVASKPPALWYECFMYLSNNLTQSTPPFHFLPSAGTPPALLLLKGNPPGLRYQSVTRGRWLARPWPTLQQNRELSPLHWPHKWKKDSIDSDLLKYPGCLFLFCPLAGGCDTPAFGKGIRQLFQKEIKCKLATSGKNIKNK